MLLNVTAYLRLNVWWENQSTGLPSTVVVDLGFVSLYYPVFFLFGNITGLGRHITEFLSKVKLLFEVVVEKLFKRYK